MDDQLELPTSIVSKDPQDEENESSDEDEMPDWTNIPGIRGISRATIPKRGEKEFEPAAGGATALQSHVLNKSRNAMFEALRGSRGASSKTISYAIWYPNIARAHVVVARGTHFLTLGHSAVRPSNSANLEPGKPQKRLELMPEEALYLMERGSLFCWRESEAPEDLLTHSSNTLDLEDYDTSYGVPMTVQQAFAEMIGVEGLELGCYIVYAYLKRLGYIVGRATAPKGASLYPLPPPNNTEPPNTRPNLSNARALLSLFLQPILVQSHKLLAFLKSFAFGSYRSPSIIGMLGLWPRSFTPRSIFSSLRTIKTGHDISLQSHPSQLVTDEFKIFWNVWKPNTPWRKLDVPKPDFEIAVVDARKTPVPDLYQLSRLFSSVEPRPPPPPRKRGPPNAKAATSPQSPLARKQVQAKPVSFGDRVRRALGFQVHPSPPVQRPNPFVHLKAGRKSVIVAAVDGSMIHLVRFGEGEFAAWPMM
ncbi:tRNA-splicing endonuclease subunit sen54 [Ceratobasidium sp. 394]|nr:tRNA-splicing endonuclease subunit sen54 [Ceratobasidium sp. 394]KAG9093803.1 tRNA-splicing endonuclease subunit sen54 [Ceratobasidium sp. UAMH 11750]